MGGQGAQLPLRVLLDQVSLFMDNFHTGQLSLTSDHTEAENLGPKLHLGVDFLDHDFS